MYKATDNPYLSALADGWQADGFVAVMPQAEMRPFGFHRRIGKHDKEIVPCPNCDAPNARSQFLRPDWEFGIKNYYADARVVERIKWLKSSDGQALCREIGAARAWQFDGVHILEHPSRYEMTACKRCGCEVIIPGGHLNWLCANDKDRWEWYYKPCPLPPPIEYDIEGQLAAPVWMKYLWKDGKIGKVFHRTSLRLADMIEAHFTVNVHIGTIRFFTNWVVDPWGQVHLMDHRNIQALPDGAWMRPKATVPEQDSIYDPISRQRCIFVLEHCYLGSVLPPSEQVGVLIAGLAQELDFHFEALIHAVENYLSKYRPDIDPTHIIRQARFERERKRMAALRSQKAEKRNDDTRQMTLF